jgi:hypothetical protein
MLGSSGLSFCVNEEPSRTRGDNEGRLGKISGRASALAIRTEGREPASEVASLPRRYEVKPPTAALRHTALADAR